MGMWGERKKPTALFPYNEFVLTRGFKNIVELSKICLQLYMHPLGEFDNSVIDFVREYHLLLTWL